MVSMGFVIWNFLFGRAGAGAAKVSLCGCGIRGDARACALADQRAAARRSVGCDESPETRLRAPSAFASAPGVGLETDAALAGSDGAGPHLACLGSTISLSSRNTSAWRSCAT